MQRTRAKFYWPTAALDLICGALDGLIDEKKTYPFCGFSVAIINLWTWTITFARCDLSIQTLLSNTY